MNGDSRIKKSLLNARVNLICYFVALIVAFFSRKVFFDFLGAEFLGLTATITSFLGFFNLAESGVGMAIAFLLYKPIFEGDKDKINELISVFGYLYRMVGLFILGLSVLFSLFLPLIFPSTSFSWGIIYFAYYAAIFCSLLGYFVNYPQILLTADQRNYEVTGYYQVVTVVQTLAQMALIYLVNNYYVYIGLQILFSMVYSVILYWRIGKVYPWLKAEVKLGRKLFKKYPDIWKYVKQIFIHKIGGFAHYQLMPVLIYGYVSLPVVALYNNYTLIGGKLNAIVNAVLGSTNAGVGSLIAEGDKKKILDIYEKLFAIDMIAAGVIAACIYKLSSPFITLWLGEQYVLSDGIVFIISVEYFLGILRLCTDQFIQGSGLFSDIWAPLVEVFLLILVSVLCGALWGLKGVLLGPIISVMIIVYIWKPYFLFSKGFGMSIYGYWRILLVDLLALLIAFIISISLLSMFEGWFTFRSEWLNFCLMAFSFAFILLVLSVAVMCLFSSPFRNLVFSTVLNQLGKIM